LICYSQLRQIESVDDQTEMKWMKTGGNYTMSKLNYT